MPTIFRLAAGRRRARRGKRYGTTAQTGHYGRSNTSAFTTRRKLRLFRSAHIVHQGFRVARNFHDNLAARRPTRRSGTTPLARTSALPLAQVDGGLLPGSHLQDLGAAEGDVGVEGEILVGRQLQAGVAPGEFGHRDLGLQLAEVRAQAVVQALAES